MELLVICIIVPLVYFIILRAGNAFIDKSVDVGVDAATKAAKSAKKHLTPVVNSTVESINRAKNAILKPDSFSEVCPLAEFIEIHGPILGLKAHINKEGILYHTCEVKNTKGKTISINFSDSLGELTASELKARRNELFVGKMNNGKYYLYDSNFKDWEEVTL